MNNRLDSIPNVLKTLDGEIIKTAEQWIDKRRPEIVDLFSEHIYGRVPMKRTPINFKVKTTEGVMQGSALRRKVDITFEGSGGQGMIQLLLFVPIHMNKPVPAFLLLNHNERQMDADRVKSFWPAEQLVSRGYAAAVFLVKDLDPDDHDGFKNGVYGIFDPPDQPRAADAWGTIAAWAWGASRVMDYLESDPLIDEDRVAVVGHSRGGKTALWAGALDLRFAMVVSNNSGSTGAAIARDKVGETISDINNRFPHWFNENYKRYNDKEEELPVDQHMLLSLIAPRGLYVSSATNDEWADPESEFLATVLARQVYELFGLKGLNTDEFPDPESPIYGENIGYHLRTGEHNLTSYDWNCFMDMADRCLTEKK